MIHFENEMNILKKPLKTHGFREVAWNFNINTASTIENVLWISVEGFQRSRANKSKMEIKLNVKFKRSTNPSREKYCIRNSQIYFSQMTITAALHPQNNNLGIFFCQNFILVVSFIFQVFIMCLNKHMDNSVKFIKTKC